MAIKSYFAVIISGDEVELRGSILVNNE